MTNYSTTLPKTSRIPTVEEIENKVHEARPTVSRPFAFFIEVQAACPNGVGGMCSPSGIDCVALSEIVIARRTTSEDYDSPWELGTIAQALDAAEGMKQIIDEQAEEQGEEED